jgi:hypothetical protein
MQGSSSHCSGLPGTAWVTRFVDQGEGRKIADNVLKSRENTVHFGLVEI